MIFLNCCLYDSVSNNRYSFDMTGNEEKIQVLRIVSWLRNVLINMIMAASQHRPTDKTVIRPYLVIQLKKTKDAAPLGRCVSSAWQHPVPCYQRHCQTDCTKMRPELPVITFIMLVKIFVALLSRTHNRYLCGCDVCICKELPRISYEKKDLLGF